MDFIVLETLNFKHKYKDICHSNLTSIDVTDPSKKETKLVDLEYT